MENIEILLEGKMIPGKLFRTKRNVSDCLMRTEQCTRLLTTMRGCVNQGKAGGDDSATMI